MKNIGKIIDFFGAQNGFFVIHREDHFKHKNPYISACSSLEAIIAIIVVVLPYTPPKDMVSFFSIHQKQLYMYCEVVSAVYAYVFYTDQK